MSDRNGYFKIHRMLTRELGLIPASVYGAIENYAQMKDGVCRATTINIAQDLGISRFSVMRGINVLEKAGYILDETPTRRNRPHVYRCTDKLSVAVRTVSVAVRTATHVAESNMKRTKRILKADSFDRSESFGAMLEDNSTEEQDPAIEKQDELYAQQPSPLPDAEGFDSEIPPEDYMPTEDKSMHSFSANKGWSSDPAKQTKELYEIADEGTRQKIKMYENIRQSLPRGTK